MAPRIARGGLSKLSCSLEPYITEKVAEKEASVESGPKTLRSPRTLDRVAATFKTPRNPALGNVRYWMYHRPLFVICAEKQRLKACQSVNAGGTGRAEIHQPRGFVVIFAGSIKFFSECLTTGVRWTE